MRLAKMILIAGLALTGVALADTAELVTQNYTCRDYQPPATNPDTQNIYVFGTPFTGYNSSSASCSGATPTNCSQHSAEVLTAMQSQGCAATRTFYQYPYNTNQPHVQYSVRAVCEGNRRAVLKAVAEACKDIL